MTSVRMNSFDTGWMCRLVRGLCSWLFTSVFWFFTHRQQVLVNLKTKGETTSGGAVGLAVQYHDRRKAGFRLGSRRGSLLGRLSWGCVVTRRGSLDRGGTNTIRAWLH